MIEDDMCPWCGSNPETLSHAFFECAAVRDLWTEANCEKLVLTNYFSDFENLIEAWGKENVKLQQKGAALLWLIWARRNNKVFNNNGTPHNTVIARMHQLVEDYNKYNENIYGCKSPSKNKSPKCWIAPAQGCVKVNCDASLSSEGWIGLGAIARDHLGNVLFAGTRCVKGHWSLEIAECNAAPFAVKLAKQNGYRNIILESDNSGIITKLAQDATYLSNLDSLLEDDPVDYPVQVAAGYSKMLWDYMEYAGRVLKPLSAAFGMGSDRWNPPTAGHIKINSDAHISAGRWMGLGVILRDNAGRIVAAAATMRIQGRWEVEMAEVAAARFGVQVARKLGYMHIELECDAYSVARKIVQVLMLKGKFSITQIPI